MTDKEPTSYLIQLREIADADLPIFFEQQLDQHANYMAAFTSKDPSDVAAFTNHWNKIRADENITNRTIVVDGQVAGYLASFEILGEREASYWLGKQYWGRGIATQALQMFLKLVEIRPLYARVASDNIASRRVLEKCGFKVCGNNRDFANARGAEIEETILELR